MSTRARNLVPITLLLALGILIAHWLAEMGSQCGATFHVYSIGKDHRLVITTWTSFWHQFQRTRLRIHDDKHTVLRSAQFAGSVGRNIAFAQNGDFVVSRCDKSWRWDWVVYDGATLEVKARRPCSPLGSISPGGTCSFSDDGRFVCLITSRDEAGGPGVNSHRIWVLDRKTLGTLSFHDYIGQGRKEGYSPDPHHRISGDLTLLVSDNNLVRYQDGQFTTLATHPTLAFGLARDISRAGDSLWKVRTPSGRQGLFVQSAKGQLTEIPLSGLTTNEVDGDCAFVGNGDWIVLYGNDTMNVIDREGKVIARLPRDDSATVVPNDNSTNVIVSNEPRRICIFDTHSHSVVNTYDLDAGPVAGFIGTLLLAAIWSVVWYIVLIRKSAQLLLGAMGPLWMLGCICVAWSAAWWFGYVTLAIQTLHACLMTTSLIIAVILHCRSWSVVQRSIIAAGVLGLTYYLPTKLCDGIRLEMVVGLLMATVISFLLLWLFPIRRSRQAECMDWGRIGPSQLSVLDLLLICYSVAMLVQVFNQLRPFIEFERERFSWGWAFVTAGLVASITATSYYLACGRSHRWILMLVLGVLFSIAYFIEDAIPYTWDWRNGGTMIIDPMDRGRCVSEPFVPLLMTSALILVGGRFSGMLKPALCEIDLRL